MLKLFILGIVLSALVYYIIVRLGIRNIRADYKRDYEALVHAIREYKVTNRNFKVIENKFEAIERYKCRDKEELDIKEREFYRRFISENTEIVLTKNGDNERNKIQSVG